MKTAAADLIVVGAGFAGLACARAAADAGLETLVLERKPWPGSKTHSTGIIVRELAESWPIPGRLCRRIEHIRLYSPSLRTLDLASPGYYFLATDTPALLRWHLRQATAAGGVSVRFATPFTDAGYKNGGWGVNDGTFHSRFLVGADGARSPVARALGLGRNRRFLLAIEADLDPLTTLDQDSLHVFIDCRRAPGYIGWVVPGVRRTQVGLACRYPRTPSLGDFLRHIAPRIDTRNATCRGYRAGLIPCGGTVWPWSAHHALLLGDAAGTVSPLTAGGIHPAVQLGQLAGSCIGAHLLDDAPHPARSLRPALPRYAVKTPLWLLLDVLPINNRLVDRVFATAGFRSVAQTLFFHNRGPFCIDAWRDIARLLCARS